MNRRTFVRLAAGAAHWEVRRSAWAAYGRPSSLEFTRGRIPDAGAATLRLAHLSDLHLRW